MIKTSNLLLLGVAVVAIFPAGQHLPTIQANPTSEAQQQPQAEEHLFTLTLSAVQSSVASGPPVEARVVTTNISSREILFMWDCLPYQVDVVDEHMNAPPDTSLRRRCTSEEENSPNGPAGVGMSISKSRLKPGAASTDVIDLDTWYDLSQPGTYTIRVRRRAEESSSLVTSNPITVTVVPAETPQTSTTSAQARAAQPPFSLTLWTSPRALTFPPQGVWFDVISKNVSDHKVLLRTETSGKEQAGSVYKVDVRNSNGASPPKKELGRLSKIDDLAPLSSALTSTPRQAGQSLCLLPGQDWRDTIQLKDFYDINKPGQYTIQVRRWDDETKTWVKSNTITVTVTP